MAPSLNPHKTTAFERHQSESSTPEPSSEANLSSVTPKLQQQAAQSHAFNCTFEAQHNLPSKFKSSQITRALAYTRQKIDPSAHAQRETHKALDEVLIAGWRKHYQHRVSADRAKTSEAKLEHLAHALESLQTSPGDGCTLRGVLLAHSKALVHYEMGVLERDMAFAKLDESDDTPDDGLIDKALNHFENAQKAYEPYLRLEDSKPKSAAVATNRKRASDEMSIDSGAYQHPDFEATLSPVMGIFNDNSPFHTLANCIFNKACLQEEFKQTNSHELNTDLGYALSLCQKGEAYLKAAKLVQTRVAQNNASQTKRSLQTFLRALGSQPDTTAVGDSPTKKPRAVLPSELLSVHKPQPTTNAAAPIPNNRLIAHNNLRESVRSVASLYQASSDQFLRPHQVTQLNQLLDELSGPSPSVKVVCQMPTGTGKTAVMAALVALVNKAATVDQDNDVHVRPNLVIAVPSLTLVNQTKQKLLEYGQTYADRFEPLGNLTEQVGVWSGEQKEIRPITVTTYNSLGRFISRLQGTDFPQHAAWDYCDRYFHPENSNVMLVFDEAHRCNGKGLNRFLSQDRSNRVVAGFSGSADQYFDTLPLTVLNPLSITDAIDQKAITPVEFLDLQFTHHPKVQEMKKRIGIKANQELTHEQKEALDNFLVASSGITLSAARTIQKLFVEKDPATKIMVFCSTALHTRNTAEIFNSIGVGATFSYGSLSKADQEKALQQFENNPAIPVLVSCGQFDEGYDFPRERSPKGVSVVLDFVPHMHKGRLIQQRLGRATRLASDDSEKVATYIRVKLIAGEGQKQSWDLLAADGSKRYHGAPESALTQSEPFDLKPLRLRNTASRSPQHIREVIGVEAAVLEPYGAKLRFAHSNNRFIKLGEGVPDEDYEPLELSQAGATPNFSNNELEDFLASFGF